MKYVANLLARLFLLAGIATLGHANSGIKDYSNFIGDFAADQPGIELALPFTTAANGGILFSYGVYQLGLDGQPSVYLHATTPAFLAYPLQDCGTGIISEQSAHVRLGAILATGVHVRSECAAFMHMTNQSNSYVYIANAGNPATIPMLLEYPGKRLLALNLTADLNGAGSSSDLMISLLDESTGRTKVEIMDFTLGAIYSSNVIQSIIE